MSRRVSLWPFAWGLMVGTVLVVGLTVTLMQYGKNGPGAQSATPLPYAFQGSAKGLSRTDLVESLNQSINAEKTSLWWDRTRQSGIINPELGYPSLAQRKPFVDTDGEETPATFYGIPPDSPGSAPNLRKQVRVILAAKVSKAEPNFALFLGERDGLEVVACRMPTPKSLQGALDELKKLESEANPEALNPNDSLMAPNLAIRVDGGSGAPILDFRMTQGLEPLKDMGNVAATDHPRHFALDHPFLLVLRGSSSKKLVLVAWVATPEVIVKKF